MSISSRQSELFAGEDWKVIYSAFQSINLNASDPPSINQALQEYLRNNYPEDYNDWIEQSEFVAIIDLLSWLAGTLAFKTDVSVRENFLDTAEARSSILRLARFLSYNPSRNQCASGILKIVEVMTNDDVYDSFGTNLSGSRINWNDPDNSNWYEQFVAVLNDAFVSTNPFGVPIKHGSIQSVITQLYRMNALYSQNNVGFSSTVAGTSMNFEVCNADFTDAASLTELAPDPTNAFNLYYLADGNGYASKRTGFFCLFKQGSTQAETFFLPTPIANQVVDISTSNINNSDVWVQTVDDTGSVMENWTQIPVMLDSNITYNALPVTQRNVFSVITRDTDQISIRFSDGLFGNVPTGNIQITYRVSNGLSYTIQTTDIENIQIAVNYINALGVNKSLTLTLSLFESVSNATPAETIQQIQQRAPTVYATQNRMVSGEDYNTFPLQTNLAVKIKALNRVYSGQSRYFDLHDPTGTYQDLSIFADDGILFHEESDAYTEVPTSLNLSITNLISDYIQPILSSTAATNAVRSVLVDAALNGGISVPGGMTWTQSSASLYSSTGWFNTNSSLVQPGAILKFTANGKTIWVPVYTVQGSVTTVPPANTAGPVTLSVAVPTGAILTAIVPPFHAALDSATLATITSKLALNQSFSLAYDYNSGSWQVLSSTSSLGNPELSGTTLLMLVCNYMPGLWQITGRGLRYTIESLSTIEWFDDGTRAIDHQTGQARMDTISVLKVNADPSTGLALGTDYVFSVDKIWFYPNGMPEPRRTTVIMGDSNGDGYPDRPDSFLNIVPTTNDKNFLFWSIGADNLAYPNYTVLGYDTEAAREGACPVTDMGAGIGWNAATNIPLLSSGVGTIGAYYTVTTPGATPLDGIQQWLVGDIVVFNGTRWVKAPAVGAEGFQVTAAAASRNLTFWTCTVRPETSLGVWNAAINTPSLGSGAGTTGSYYIVETAGNTALDGILSWSVGDIVVFDGSQWVRGGWRQDFTETYSYAQGRGPNVAAAWVDGTGSTMPAGDQLYVHWKHYAPSNYRIDPASQNIHDVYVLTYAYDTAVRQWVTNGAVAGKVPAPPTELDLKVAFQSMEQYRMFSDAIVWRPVRYKFLFGTGADPTLQMSFKVVRIPNATLSDGQIKTNIINAINTYFNASLWDFGETFYWSELAAYVHQQLANQIASIVPVPLYAEAAFGDGFEVPCQPDEIFLSTAQVSNISIITSNTPTNLRIR